MMMWMLQREEKTAVEHEKSEMNKWVPSIDVYYSDTECLMLLLLIHFPWNKSITHSHTIHIHTHAHM